MALQAQKIYITHLNHCLINLINKYIHHKSDVLSTFSWLEPVLTPARDIRMTKSGNNPVHSHSGHILSHALSKSNKNLFMISSNPILWWCMIKLFWVVKVSIFEDLVEMIVALTLKIAKYFHLILWLMMVHNHTKFNRSQKLSGRTYT